MPDKAHGLTTIHIVRRIGKAILKTHAEIKKLAMLVAALIELSMKIWDCRQL